jgi:DNA processing protein
MRILDALGRRPLSFDDVAARSGMARGEVAAALGTLQLTGAVRRMEGGWVRARR